MNKIVTQGFLLVALFAGSWWLLSQVNWVRIFRVEKISNTTEKKLGDMFLDVFRNKDDEMTDSVVVGAVDSIVTKICDANEISRSRIKLHVLSGDEVNAFALPDGHLVLFTGIIQAAENPEELSGIIGHEMAHIQLNHVMKKLVKEVGLSMLVSMTTGGGGPELIREVARKLSSTAFDRRLEKEADMQSVDYLHEAGINPAPFADLMFRLSENSTSASRALNWVSTHPDSGERASYLAEYSLSKKTKYGSALSRATWEALKEKAQAPERE